MRRLAFCLALAPVFPFVSAAAPPSSSIRFHTGASEFSNVLYHVGCLSGQISCTQPVFTRFWHEQLHWTPADQKELDAWSAILNEFSGAQPYAPAAPLLPNYLGYYPSLKAINRLVASALEAHDSASFITRMSPFVSSRQAVRLGAVLNHFAARFHPWWQANVTPALAAHVQQAAKRIVENKMDVLAGQVAAFTGAQLPTPDVYLHAIAGPDPASTESSATVRQNHFFVEVVKQDTPDATAWKAIHELTHYFYDTAPPENHLALMQQFVDGPEPAAPVLYEYLNEALATSVQLLIFERLGLKDDDPYHQAYIPRLARATLPLLKKALAEKGSLFSGFSKPYVQAGMKELGSESASPMFLLSAPALIASDKNRPALDAFREVIPPLFTVDSERDWKLFPEVNGARFLTYDELGENNTEAKEFTSHRGFAFVVPHARKSRMYIFAGKDSAGLLDVIKQFAARKPEASAGLLFTVD